MKKNLLNSGLALILLVSLLLIGCESVSREGRVSSAESMLYQPPTLFLQAGVPVKTKEGTYTPQVDEVWHSHARFTALEQENIDLAAALAALKRQSKMEGDALRQLWRDGAPEELPWEIQYKLARN